MEMTFVYEVRHDDSRVPRELASLERAGPSRRLVQRPERCKVQRHERAQPASLDRSEGGARITFEFDWYASGFPREQLLVINSERFEGKMFGVMLKSFC